MSNIYAAPDEEAVAFAGLLDNVAIHEIANDEKKNLILKMDSQEKYCCTAITQDTDRTGMLSHGNDPDEVRPAKAAVIATWGYAPLYWMQYQKDDCNENEIVHEAKVLTYVLPYQILHVL